MVSCFHISSVTFRYFDCEVQVTGGEIDLVLSNQTNFKLKQRYIDQSWHRITFYIRSIAYTHLVPPRVAMCSCVVSPVLLWLGNINWYLLLIRFGSDRSARWSNHGDTKPNLYLRFLYFTFRTIDSNLAISQVHEAAKLKLKFQIFSTKHRL